MQEFALAFLEVERVFIRGRGPSAMMALFKRRVSWTLMTLIRRHLGKYAAERKIHASTVDRFDDLIAAESVEDLTDLKIDIGQAPKPIRLYLQAKMVGPLKRDGESLSDAIKRVTGLGRATFHRRLSRWWESQIGPIPA